MTSASELFLAGWSRISDVLPVRRPLVADSLFCATPGPTSLPNHPPVYGAVVLKRFAGIFPWEQDGPERPELGLQCLAFALARNCRYGFAAAANLILRHSQDSIPRGQAV